MSPSIAKREKLFGPLQLVLIGVLFAVSFFFLLPRQDAFEIGAADTQDSNGTAIGELDLAYLKARGSSGEQSVEETSNAVVALVRTGQLAAAQELLDQQPDASIGAQQRFSLDLEMARVQYFAAENDEQREFRELELLNRIELLVNDQSIRTKTSLSLSVELTEQLGKPNTSVKLYELLAVHDADNAGEWYGKCANTYAMQGQSAKAEKCFDKAIAASTSQESLFDLKVAQLAGVAQSGNEIKKNQLLKELSQHKPLSIEQREELATLMLANGRSDLAYVEYANLADQDKAREKDHLLSAAKWAEGSNAGDKAAVYAERAAGLATGAEKVKLEDLAARLLVASGNNAKAFEKLVTRINAEPNNAALLEEGVVRAQQYGKPDLAAEWNARLVKIDPSNINAVNTQVKLSFANSDLPGAAKWSAKAVELAPNNREARLQLAQVSEWNGDPVAAMKQWQWLAKNNPNKENITQLVRLATLNRESKVAADGLQRLVALDPTDDEKIVQLVGLYELEGTPVAGANMLAELQAKSGKRAFTQREQARLYQRHSLFPEALASWTSYAEDFGRSSEETLNRMELHWRLNQPEKAAEVIKVLVGTSNISEATQPQIGLISELAWRYKMHELAELIKPLVKDVEGDYEVALLNQRLVTSLEDAGRNDEAIVEATRLFQDTGSSDLAFKALSLAIKTGNSEGVSELLEDNEDTAKLREKSSYWNMAATIHQQSGDRDKANAAREKALELNPSDTGALSGLLWGHIDANDTDAIKKFLVEHRSIAETESNMWSAFAVAHVFIGNPEQSLTWFERQLDTIEADYGMLLTYGDALEYAGRAEDARKVRLYTFNKLRPALAAGAADDTDELLRQYAQLMNRYGSAEEKERLTTWMLDDVAQRSVPGKFWREDIAIGWLMATERHGYARLVMAKLHEQRLKTPVWQELAIAMASKDLRQIQSVIDGTGNVSIGNHILALRQLGRDQDAFILASSSINSAPTLSDRNIARSQFSAMRSERPSYAASRVKQTSMNGLGINQTGFTIRHSLASMNIGFALDFTQSAYSSDRFDLNGISDLSDLALTLHHGDRQFGGSLTAGMRATNSDDLGYAIARHHLSDKDGRRTLTAELAYNEGSTDSALLRVAAKQSRVSLGYEQLLGAREYFKLQADVRDINTRVQQNRIALGLSARMEIGIRGAIGSNVWSTSLSATQANNNLVSSIPEDLAFSRYSTVEELISETSTSLLLGASLSRGGVAGDYPQVSSPRYYLNANVGSVWPNPEISAQFDGGAGVRILGGDELSFGFSYDSQPFNNIGGDNDTTTFGVNYQYHF